MKGTRWMAAVMFAAVVAVGVPALAEDSGAADAALAEVQARARAGAAHFTEAIAGADSLRVRKAELPHSSFSGPVAYETADPEEIAELGRVIRFEAPWDGGLCACIGEPTFEWLRDGELLVKATFVGGHEIRWHDAGADCGVGEGVEGVAGKTRDPL